MTKNILPAIFLILSIFSYGLGEVHGELTASPVSAFKDSIENQILYNGRIWNNPYSGIDGHPFLFSAYFLAGSVKIDDYTFDNVRIRYDIINDELLIQGKDGIIIQLNKEIISSFYLWLNDEVLNFRNFDNDSGSAFAGYWNVLYEAGIKIYVKYKKEILPTSFTNGPPRFNQVSKVYIIKDGRIYRTDTRKDLLNIFGTKSEKQIIKEYIRDNHIRISRKDPGVFRRVIEYYETVTK